MNANSFINQIRSHKTYELKPECTKDLLAFLKNNLEVNQEKSKALLTGAQIDYLGKALEHPEGYAFAKINDDGITEINLSNEFYRCELIIAGNFEDDRSCNLYGYIDTAYDPYEYTYDCYFEENDAEFYENVTNFDNFKITLEDMNEVPITHNKKEGTENRYNYYRLEDEIYDQLNMMPEFVSLCEYIAEFYYNRGREDTIAEFNGDELPKSPIFEPWNTLVENKSMFLYDTEV